MAHPQVGGHGAARRLDHAAGYAQETGNAAGVFRLAPYGSSAFG